MEAEFQSYPNYLRVSLSGKWEANEAKNALKACHEAAHSAMVEKVLIDLRLVEPPDDPIVRFDTAEELIRICGTGMKISVIKRRDDPETLGEQVARSRGANLKVHLSEKSALEWLLSD